MIRVPLKNISLVINSGLTPLRSNQEFWLNGSIPWVKTEQLGEKNIYDSNEKITTYALENTSIRLNPPNTLSVAMYGEGKTRGSVSILRNETTTNQACCNIVIDEKKANFEFVYYYLKTQYNNLRNLSSGVRKNLNSNDIKNFEINLPNLSTQKQIAKVLSDLDAKIEVNNNINQELEAMAKTLYNYWFVQFDFPDANSKPYKTSGGKMVYNVELKREIPEGWEVKELKDFGNVITGQTPSIKNPEHWGNELPFITPSDFNKKKKYFTESNRYLSTSGKVAFQQKILPANSILVTCIGSDMGKVAYNEKECLTNQQLNSINLTNLIYGEYIYQFLESIYEHLISMGKTGSTVPIVNKSTFEKIKALNPNIDIMELFAKSIYPFNEKIKVNLNENQKLSELRDWLLPMLMNGQVTVREAKEQLGMVAEDGETYKKE